MREAAWAVDEQAGGGTHVLWGHASGARAAKDAKNACMPPSVRTRGEEQGDRWLPFQSGRLLREHEGHSEHRGILAAAPAVTPIPAASGVAAKAGWHRDAVAVAAVAAAAGRRPQEAVERAV